MRISLRAHQPVIVYPAGWNLPEGFPSRLLDWEEEQDMTIAPPTQHGSQVEIEPGAQLIVEIPLPDGLRRYTTRVRENRSGAPNLLLEWPREAERIQRRSDVRVPTQLPVKIELDDFDPGSPIVHCKTADLSAGGAQLLLADELPTQTLFRVTVELPERGPQTCDAVVVRTGSLEKPTKNEAFWAGIAFLGIPSATKREFTKYVFDMQRELLRRGTL